MWENLAILTCGVACGVVLGIALDEGIRHMKTEREIQSKKVLETCLGEPMCTDTLTLEQIRDWVKEREKPLKEGHKVIVAKATSNKLKTLGLNMNLGDDSDHYMIVAVINTSKPEHTVTESLLIKYEKLDDMLQNCLNPGDGILVVEE